MNTEKHDTPHETFNRRFDALFAENCRDSNGRLHLVRQGKFGMGLVVSYLSKINWSTGFPLDLVELKLQRLITELKGLQYVPDSIDYLLSVFTIILLGDLDLYAPSILPPNSRIAPTHQHPSFSSNAKPSRITALAKRRFLRRLSLSQQKTLISLLRCRSKLIHLYPALSIPHQLQPSARSLPLPLTAMVMISQSNVKVCFPSLLVTDHCSDVFQVKKNMLLLVIQ